MTRIIVNDIIVLKGSVKNSSNERKNTSIVRCSWQMLVTVKKQKKRSCLLQYWRTE